MHGYVNTGGCNLLDGYKLISVYNSNVFLLSLNSLLLVQNYIRSRTKQGTQGEGGGEKE